MTMTRFEVSLDSTFAVVDQAGGYDDGHAAATYVEALYAATVRDGEAFTFPVRVWVRLPGDTASEFVVSPKALYAELRPAARSENLRAAPHSPTP
jgi:hypothetical protein